MSHADLIGGLRVLERRLRTSREPIRCDLVDRVSVAITDGQVSCPASVDRLILELRDVAQGDWPGLAIQRRRAAVLLVELRKWRRLAKDREQRAAS